MKNSIKKIFLIAFSFLLLSGCVLNSVSVSAATASQSDQKAIKSFLKEYKIGNYLWYYSMSHGKIKSEAKLKTDMVTYYAWKKLSKSYNYYEYGHKYYSYTSYRAKYNTYNKNIIKKYGKKMFGNSFKPSYYKQEFYVNDNGWVEKKELPQDAMYQLSKDGSYILDWLGDTGDYDATVKISSIEKTNGKYVVKYTVKASWGDSWTCKYRLVLVKKNGNFTISKISSK